MSDIITILEQHNIPFRKTNSISEILIKCTSGEHEDKNPSLSYNLDKNKFQCWSCGFKGDYKKFLKSIGINITINTETRQSFRIEKLKNKLQTLISTELILPDSIPFETEFRNISPKTIKEFNAFTTFAYGLENYVSFPIYQFNKLRFIESRFRFGEPEDRRKYLRYPAHSIVTDVLFPLDKLEDKKHIILVEGLFDMLNLWQYGVHNVACIFGTQNFSLKKIATLDKLGTTKITLMMDGDIAGKKATEKIYNMLESKNIFTTIINLPENKDPGSLNEQEIITFLNQN